MKGLDPSQNKFSQFFKSLFTWRLQVNLSTVFIGLIFLFTMVGSYYTYLADSRQLTNLSSIVINQVSKLVTHSIGQVTEQALIAAKSTRSLIEDKNQISASNELLVGYLIDEVNENPYIEQIAIAREDGGLLAVISLLGSKDKYYYFNPLKLLPANCAFAIRSIVTEGVNKGEYWTYLDINYKKVTEESVPVLGYDPREFKWYQNVISYPRPWWDQLVVDNKNIRRLSVAVPIVSEDNQIYSLVRVVLSWDQISNLISLQKIGETGWAVILNEQGELISSNVLKKVEQDNILETIYSKFDQIKKDQLDEMTILVDEKKYLIKIVEFPIGYESKWYILIISPLIDFFGPFFKIESEKLRISILLVVIFGLFIYFFSKRIASPIVILAEAVDKIRELNFSEYPKIRSRISEIISLDRSINGMRVALKSFGRYVPKEVVKKFIDQRQTIDTSTERRDLTILFSDIENFTTISETISSETLTQLLSAYFGYFSKIIVENEGTIDKYIGDSMMAFWNAPNYVIDHGQKACYAALKFMKILKNEDEKNILMKAKTRFGIHSGEVLVGNIGTQERLNYTVIGNAVNTASRLESLNKTYGTTILISESTHEKIGLRFISRPIDFIVVKGRTQGITIFEILGLQEENQELSATPQERELSSLFSKAYAEFQSGHLDMAKKLFYEIIEKFPNDQPTKIYLERLKES